MKPKAEFSMIVRVGRLGVRAVAHRALALLGCALLSAAPAMAGETRNVVLITIDGVRWQEVFSGADPLLLNDKAGGSWQDVELLKKDYWREGPRERRKLLMPFLWSTIASQGQIFGNKALGSHAHVTNPHHFSYPGYNEMATGAPDPRIDRNEYGQNPHQTVFEWLNGLPELSGQVEIFGGWRAFHDIFNPARSHLPVRAGKTLVDPADTSPRGQLLLELYQRTTRLDGDDPLDSFLYEAVKDHLEAHQPRVLFVGFGDTDNWAHAGRYDALLETIHNVDWFIGRLWAQMQSMPQYRGTTTFIVTTDHGRGSGPVEWKEHGVEQKGSDNVWIAVLGPDTPALGERRGIVPVTQAQIAATVAALLGKDFRAAAPKAAPPIADVLGPARAVAGAH